MIPQPLDEFTDLQGLTELQGLRPVSPFLEMGAYEVLWQEEGASFKSLAAKFRDAPHSRPSDFVGADEAFENAESVRDRFNAVGISDFGVRVNGAAEYPNRLRDARHPVELLYFEGWWDLVFSPSVAVVGTRDASSDGIRRTKDLVRKLVEDDFTIFSGLAQGTDRAAHEAAIDAGGRTVAVLGTPLSDYYPKAHQELQREIAKNYLLISQVPVQRWYNNRDDNRFFFPERNITMSALTEATIVVEAGETSGTRQQVRAAYQQERSIFILDNVFHDPRVTWADWAVKRNAAIRVRSYDDIQRVLSAEVHEDRRTDAAQPLLFAGG